MFSKFVVALCAMCVAFTDAAGWHAGENVNTVLGVAVGSKNNSEVYATGYNGHTGFVYYSYDLSNAASSVIIPTGNAINMDVALSPDGTNICTVGGNGIWYGKAQGTATTLQKSTFFDDVVSQHVSALGHESGFAAVGRFDGVNGVATSEDGNIWSVFPIGPDDKSNYLARFGSFPSNSVWYVTASTWPRETDDKLRNGHVARVSPRLSIYFDVGDGTPQTTFMSARNLVSAYPGAIFKTTNQGASFTEVFNSLGDFMINQIDCFDVNNCVAVGENAKKAVVIATTDGGANWDTKMTLTGPYSLHAVKMFSATNIFVAGGTPSVGPYATKEWVGKYYISSDGGASWNLDTTWNGYGFDYAFWDQNRGYATALFKKNSYVWIWE